MFKQLLSYRASEASPTLGCSIEISLDLYYINTMAEFRSGRKCIAATGIPRFA